jgi:hypothetical protein
MDLVEKYLGDAMGFVQKLPYQLKKGGKKQLSADDRALLKARGGTGRVTTTRGGGETNLSSTPNRPEPTNKKTSKVRKVLQQSDDALVKVGDIFYNSWGYGQTNIDWYQVVSVSPTGKTVKIREIHGILKGTGDMTGKTMPDKNKWKGKVQQKKVRVSGKEVNLPMRHGWCPMWDGKPKDSSWYH